MHDAVELKREAPASPTPPGGGATEAAPREVQIQLYAKREEVYPRQRIGDSLAPFQKLRWAAVWATQIVFYGLPWLQWNGRQALLFDLGARKFYVFGLVLWPQDIIYLTVLLIISALGLFLFTAVAGRVWCGFSCPQTVYTEIFMWIERLIEGDRAKRMRLDKEPRSVRKTLLKTAKHAAWIAVALWTGLTFVGYFTPIRPLVVDVATLSVGGWALFWILFYGFATYGNAGWMREQVCTYMCPYARFQSSMFDADTLIVSYDARRGEPRGAGSKKASRTDLGLGDCVDCSLCVQVCPTGIDIRNGLQHECISCAACIDACDFVMVKVGQPKGLIRYATERSLQENYAARGIWSHVLRPRVLIYGALIGVVTVGLVSALMLRVPLKVDVIRDRGALAREVDDGLVENTFRLQVMNTGEQARTFTLTAAGLPGLAIDSEPTFSVPGASTQTVLLRLRARPDDVPPGSNRIVIGVASVDEPKIAVEEKSVFLGLKR